MYMRHVVVVLLIGLLVIGTVVLMPMIDGDSIYHTIKHGLDQVSNVLDHAIIELGTQK